MGFSSLLEAARPRQWVKNFFVFAPVTFGLKLTDEGAVVRAALTFIAFCFAASSAYLINDLRDLEQDRRNWRTRSRPLARGALGPKSAVKAAVSFAAIAMAFASLSGATPFLLLYLVLSQAYNVFLKRVAGVDVLVLASLYLVRLLGGSAAASVTPSFWLLLCGGLLAFVLGLGKRSADPPPYYPRRFLPFAFRGSLLATGVAYLVYTLLPSTHLAFGPGILATNLPVAAGLLRFWHLVKGGRGDPSDALWRDRGLQAAVITWTVLVVVLTLAASPR